MSQTSSTLHRFSLKRRPGTEGETATTGANTLLELDGQPLRGVTYLKLELKPGRIAKIVLEMVANVEDIPQAVGELEIRPRK